jgi:catechol 2,3-dioxygenase-like lactoylglutathione lyase family enzyme
MHNLAHIGVQVKDLAASERFYIDALKCKKSGRIETGNVRIAFLDFANGTIELVQLLGEAESVHHGPFAHLAFEVSDINGEYKRIKSIGAEMIDEAPRAFNDGQLFFFKGPDGESIEFCSGIRIDPV